MEVTRQNDASEQRYACEKCGAAVLYKPGSTLLHCEYCGHDTPIKLTQGRVLELDLVHHLSLVHNRFEVDEDASVHCDSCGATFTVPALEDSKECPFCGSRHVVEGTRDSRIPPNGILPFAIESNFARGKVGEWLGSRFWAPNNLKALALKEGKLRGVYLPFWTFDSFTITDYTGLRGTYYYVTVNYTTTENGRTVTRSRQERRIRWSPAAGRVEVPFDDVLVQATSVIPPQISERLQTWDLPNAVPPQSEYLVGYQSLRYDMNLEQGLAVGRERMQPGIDQAIRWDIGGDAQQILTKNTQYLNNTFKLLQLPVWVGGYRYRNKPYRFVVNGRTGEVQGEAPVSFWKVFFAVLLGLLIVGAIVYFSEQNKDGSSSIEFSTSY